jgi:hypothetical protein
MRIAFLQATRESRRGPGPHECSHCGRIIYTVECPTATLSNRNDLSDTDSDGSGFRPGTSSGFRVAKETQSARRSERRTAGTSVKGIIENGSAEVTQN